MIKTNLHLINWASGDHTGASSKAILRFMMGLEPNHWGYMPPSDKEDRVRCIKLLRIEPEFFARLSEMRTLSKEWNEQIDLILEEIQE